MSFMITSFRHILSFNYKIIDQYIYEKFSLKNTIEKFFSSNFVTIKTN